MPQRSASRHCLFLAMKQLTPIQNLELIRKGRKRRSLFFSFWWTKIFFSTHHRHNSMFMKVSHHSQSATCSDKSHCFVTISPNVWPLQRQKITLFLSFFFFLPASSWGLPIVMVTLYATMATYELQARPTAETISWIRDASDISAVYYLTDI